MKKTVIVLVVMLFVSFVTVSYSQENAAPAAPQKVKQNDTSETQKAKKEEDVENLMPHRDIKDLPVPYAMKLDKDNTYIIDVKGVKLGLLTYTGRVDGYSLAENIKIAFAEEKWKLQSMQNYKKTVSLSFTKDDRICNVFIEEGFFTTKLELRIAVIGVN